MTSAASHFFLLRRSLLNGPLYCIQVFVYVKPIGTIWSFHKQSPYTDTERERKIPFSNNVFVFFSTKARTIVYKMILKNSRRGETAQFAPFCQPDGSPVHAERELRDSSIYCFRSITILIGCFNQFSSVYSLLLYFPASQAIDEARSKTVSNVRRHACFLVI